MLTLQSRLTKCLPHRLKSQLLLTQRLRLWRTKDDDALSAFAAEHVADLLSHQCVAALPPCSLLSTSQHSNFLSGAVAEKSQGLKCKAASSKTCGVLLISEDR